MVAITGNRHRLARKGAPAFPALYQADPARFGLSGGLLGR
ncbi:hypothetical protein MTBLM5_180022 [Magnetospirillum sp. LM-5]|nr:hypothetical protein MTBLM5_180022 [Magnetospirillum sp. LM-5]